MTSTRTTTWQDIHQRIRSNISDRTWQPGELIPGEAALAEQFGCARTTVNRALRELAATGVIDRKRKAGTRVARQQTRRVTGEIPVIRAQVQSRQQHYHFDVLEKVNAVAPAGIREALKLDAKNRALRLCAIHFADNEPFIYEDRWINTQTVPDILDVDLAHISANEWLVENVPFTNGEFIVEAGLVNKAACRALKLDCHTAVLKSRRTTWLENRSVTSVSLSYRPGYQMHFAI